MQRTLWQKAAGVIGMGHGSLPIAHVGCHYRVKIMHRKLSSSENLHFVVHHLGRLEKGLSLSKICVPKTILVLIGERKT